MAQPRVRETRRVWVPAAFFGAFALVVSGRLVQVQIVDHDTYATRARTELTTGETLYARRGSILDRNGNVLATSVDTWDIYVSSRVWKDDGKAKEGSETIARILAGDLALPKTDAASLRSQVQQSQSVDVLIARDVDFETGNLLTGSNIPGLIALHNTARINPEGDTGGSVLGLIGQDNVGLAGIEAEYNDLLQGKPGKAIYERDTTGEPIPFGQHIVMDPEPGQDIVLTIDRYLQRLAEQRLAQAVTEHRAKRGAIIVMDPATGEILALATSPALKYSTLDLNDPKQMELLKNPAISDLYEPGSVMKIVTASAAIDAGVVSPNTTYVDTGIAYIYGIPIRNWQDEVWGTQTMTGVLQHSINTGAIFMAEKLGDVAFQKYLDAFGFGRPSGIDFPGEAAGIFRRSWDKDWSPVDLATQAFGQAISVTPVQMMAAAAAAINGGNLVRPHFVKAQVSPDGTVHEVKPEVVDRAISPETSATIRSMLGEVIGMDPPGVGRNPRNYTAGGKSGTANVAVINGYNDTQIASFVGFAPLNNPRILVLVKLDENADGQTGTAAAGPIFAHLADEMLGYLGLPPGKGAVRP